MNLRLRPRRRQRLSNLLDQRPLRHSAVNFVSAFSCLCFSRGCSAKWEGAGQDTILPIQIPGEEVPGEEVLGEEVHGKAELEASHQVEAEAFRVLECEVEAVVVAQDARINK